MSDERCESLRDLGDGSILRCDRGAGHDGEHERWLMFHVWRWGENLAVRMTRTETRQGVAS